MRRRIFRATRLALGFLGAMPAWAGLPRLDVYGDLPGIEDMSISPSGTGIAIAGRVGNERQLVAVGAQREVRAAAPPNDTKLRDIRWAGEDIVLAVTSVTENLGQQFTRAKAEISGAIIVSAAGGPPQLVFGRTPTIVHAIFGLHGIRKIDNDWFGYFRGLELRRSLDRGVMTLDHGRPALFAVNLKSNSPRRIARPAGESHGAYCMIDAKGEVAATLDIGSVNGRWTILNANGEEVASGTAPTGGVRLISFSQDGGGVIYSVESDVDGKTHWYEAPLSGGTAREMFADVNIDRSFVDPTTGRILGYIASEAGSKPVFSTRRSRQPSRRSIVLSPA